MPGFLHLLRCVGRSVAKNGGKALACLVPFGEVTYEIARDALEEYRRDCGESQMRTELQDLAQASQADVRQAAEEVAAGEPPEARQALAAYLGQMPASIRQSLRRPSDPSGTTVPAGLSFKKPEDLLPFLPAGLPRFKPGDRPLAADWELVEMLGKGGFGEVWKARHIHQSRKKPVALKFCLDPVSAATLRNEAKLHDLLDRVREEASAPGIVPLLETYLGSDPPCLMYEYVEGGDLSGFVQEAKAEGRLTPDLATRIVHRLASIVAVAHRLEPHIVHRDLKMSNALVRRGAGDLPDLLVADFGIGGLAAGQALGEAARHATGGGRTLPTAVRGAYTPLYASPQQIAGDPPDPRDDVYSLGVLWYQMVSGDLGMMAVPPDWREVAEERGLPEEPVKLLAACIASRKEKRPPDASVLAGRLAGSSVGLNAEVARPTEQVAARPLPETDVGRQGQIPAARPPKRAEGRLNLPGPGTGPTAGAQGNRKTLEEVRQIELGVPGDWSARPPEAPPDAWTWVAWTPGLLRFLEPGRVYRLMVRSETTDARLAGLGQLWGLPCLQALELMGCEAITDAGMAYLSGLTGLEKLRLHECQGITDAGLAHLRPLTGLRSLILSGCRLVGDAGLAHLKTLAALEELDLNLCVLITDAGLAHLRDLTALRRINLIGCRSITDTGLAHLKGLVALQHLSLGYCERISDRGLAHLQGLAGLRSLDLSCCPGITDAGLAHLKRLTALQTLDVKNCRRVTDLGVTALMEALPHCTMKR